MRILAFIYALVVGFIGATLLTVGASFVVDSNTDPSGLVGLHIIAWALMTWSVARARRKERHHEFSESPESADLNARVQAAMERVRESRRGSNG